MAVREKRLSMIPDKVSEEETLSGGTVFKQVQVQWYYVKGPGAPLRYSFCGLSSRRYCSIVLIWSHKVAGQM
jgi:hypothetical protein